MHGIVKFLIVSLRSLLFCFCTVLLSEVSTVQYNVVHKFVGVFDNPPCRSTKHVISRHVTYHDICRDYTH